MVRGESGNDKLQLPLVYCFNPLTCGAAFSLGKLADAVASGFMLQLLSPATLPMALPSAPSTTCTRLLVGRLWRTCWRVSTAPWLSMGRRAPGR